MNCAFTSPDGLLSNCRSWVFYMLCYISGAFPRYSNSSKIPSKFRKYSFSMKALKIGIFGRFLAEQKMYYLAIFLPNSTLTGMSYVSVLDRRLYGVGQHFTCCKFSPKKKILSKL